MEIANLQHFNHECPLTLLSSVGGICDWCHGKISDETAYGCSKCPNFLMHERCAKLAREINHPFHPQHPLMLLSASASRKFKCDACGRDGKHSNYHCSQCDFDLHHTCASLVTININATDHDDDDDDDDDDKRTRTLTHPMYEHEHPLILCTIVTEEHNNKHVVECSRCSKPIKSEIIYVCRECPMVAHKSCSNFPAKIQHPSHPHHVLSLYYQRDISASANALIPACYACRFPVNKFIYSCWCGEFKLHAECALPMPTVKFKLHPHPLTYFIDCPDYYEECYQCRSRHDPCWDRAPCWDRVFCCVKCRKFGMHLHCAPTLPTIVNHKCHLHPLTLTESPVKHSWYDDDNEVHSGAKLYCDACETERDLYCPTYYCAQCHYVAHVHCIISKDIIALGEEEICVVESYNEEEIEVLTHELTKLEYERERKISELAKLDNKMEKLTAKVKELKQGE